MSYQCGAASLQHHLLTQLLCNAAGDHLPAGCGFGHVVFFRVNAPQPLPERLVYCKIELGTGRGAGISVFIACGSGNVLRQVPHQRGCLLAPANFISDAVLPTTAQLVQQNSLKCQTITERIIHEKVFVPVLHR